MRKHLHNEVDSLAQQVEHIPFKDGVLGSSPKRITETRDSSEPLVFLFPHNIFYYLELLSSLGCSIATLFPMKGFEVGRRILPRRLAQCIDDEWDYDYHHTSDDKYAIPHCLAAYSDLTGRNEAEDERQQ